MCPGDALIAVGADVGPPLVRFLNKQGTVRCRKLRDWIIKRIEDESLVDRALAMATDDCLYVSKFDKSGKSRGLGDTIANVTKAVGITPCKGCEKRRALLNKLVPYKESK